MCHPGGAVEWNERGPGAAVCAQAVFVASSNTDGSVWSNPVATPLPNSNSAQQACRLPSGNVAVVFDNSRSGRWPLSIAVTSDSGRTFPWVRDLEPAGGPALSPISNSGGEYSYPSLVCMPTGVIHLSWTHLREKVRYMRITEAWLYERGGTYGQFRAQ